MFGTRRLYKAIGQGIILALLIVALVGANSLSAQQQTETRGDQSPALIAGRDAIVTYGLTPEQVQELTKAAAAGAVGPLADKIVDLSNRLGVTQGATLTMLRILDQRDVPLEQLPQKLAEVADQYKKFQAQLAALNPQNPLARGLVEQAQAEIKVGKADSLIKAHQLLRQAKQAQIAAAQQARNLRQKAQVAEDEQLIQAAASSAAEGDLAMTELHYLQGADLFKEAANLVPPGNAYEDKRIDYLQTEERALYQQGEEFGDNSALRSAIERSKRLIDLQPRERVPLDWAQTQTNLGNALQSLGERESGTARLEEAVAAYREALKERTRERVPLAWAQTQTNLGTALGSLGERESGTARLEEAVAAYREALKEQTRERVPLDWATTQTNLGTALQSLGGRESGTARLEEAVAAYREALKERTRERVPLAWAHDADQSRHRASEPWRARERHGAARGGGGGLSRGAEGADPRARAARLGQTQTNLGNALQSLGERESGTARLEEGAAYREALKERTRERVPLDWATTQNNLGAALQSLGERESGTARLEEAVAAYREALKERTRERVPLDWARTQTNLGDALGSLGERESGTARLEEAVAAYREALKEQHPRARAARLGQDAEQSRRRAWEPWRARERTARLEEAVAAYREALKERTRERVPLDWARTQTNLGAALGSLGGRESGTARLEEAVAAYREALKERTRERVPLDWARTQNNLGAALGSLGGRESGAARGGGGGLSRGAEGADARARAARLGHDAEQSRHRASEPWRAASGKR